MADGNEILDHVARQVPPPDGALAQLLLRQSARQRNRRLATAAAVLAAWVVLVTAIAAISIGSKEESRPAVEPVPTTTSGDAPVIESHELPSAFPDDLPLPEGIVPVAHRDTAHTVQVWFRTEMPQRDLYEFFDRTLDRTGWTKDGPSSPFFRAGIWDRHVRSRGRSVAVLGLKDPSTPRLLHGSHGYPPDRWDLYVVMTPSREDVPEQHPA